MSQVLSNKQYHRWLIGSLFIFAGVMHFVAPDFFLEIMPPFIPFHLEIVYISGIFEIILGLGMFIPRFATYAGYGLIALAIAVYPANIYMALDSSVMEDVPRWIAWARLPLQFVLIGYIYWSTRDEALMPSSGK